jgi:hypothetical protein
LPTFLIKKVKFVPVSLLKFEESEPKKKAPRLKAKGLVRPDYYFNGTPCDAYPTISKAKYGTTLKKKIQSLKNTIPV